MDTIAFQVPIQVHVVMKSKAQEQSQAQAQTRRMPYAARRARQSARQSGRQGTKHSTRRDSIDLVPSERPLMRATWRGRVLAESREYQYIDGRFYFPGNHVDWAFLAPTEQYVTRNPYGKAEWHDLLSDGVVNKKAAWCFGSLRKPHSKLGGYTAFWKGVVVKQHAPVPWLTPCPGLEIEEPLLRTFELPQLQQLAVELQRVR